MKKTTKPRLRPVGSRTPEGKPTDIQRANSQQMGPEAANSTFGKTSREGAITLYEPTQAGDALPSMTVIHERMHQGLLRLTAFGHLTNLLAQLSKTGRYTAELELCQRDQESVQEAMAYYVSLASVAREHPESLQPAIDSINTRHRRGVDALLKLLPLNGVPQDALRPRGLLIEAIARASFNGGCLQAFSDPRLMTVENLTRYLAEQGTRVRFERLLRILVKGNHIRALEAQAKAELTAGDDEAAINRLFAKLLNAVGQIAHPDMVVVSPLTIILSLWKFQAEWKRSAKRRVRIPLPTLPPPTIIDSPDYLAGLRNTHDLSRPLNLRFLRLLLGLIDANNVSLYLWLYLRNTHEVFVEWFLAGLDSEGKTPDDSYQRYAEGIDYGSGVVPIRNFVNALRKAPTGCAIVTFLHLGWALWKEATKGERFKAFALTGCAEREVSDEALQRLLAFPNLRSNATWYGVTFEEDVRVAYIISETDPRVFGVVRLVTNVAVEAFAQLAMRAGIGHSSPAASKLNKRVREVAAYPHVVGPLARSDHLYRINSLVPPTPS